ncbi:MAG: hypothetical protein WDM76_08875 [Limisphaerales bacterium]
MHFLDKEISYDELFYRKSDAIVLRARTVELVDRGYADVMVRLSPTALDIGGEKINPDDVAYIEATSSEIVLPREAMGMGDVKFMAGIGAFNRLAGRGFFAGGQFHHRRGGGCAADSDAKARVVVADALRPLHRAGGGDLGIWRARNFLTGSLGCRELWTCKPAGANLNCDHEPGRKSFLKSRSCRTPTAGKSLRYIVEAEEDAQTLAECDQRALERFQMLDAMEAEDEKNLAR